MKNSSSYLLVLLIGIIGYLNYFHQAPVINTEDYLFWGQLNIILHFIFIIVYFDRKIKFNVFPFIPIIAIFQMLTFGFSVFFIRINSFQLNRILNLEAMKLAFYGFSIFYFTFFGMYKYIFQKIKPFHPIPFDYNFKALALIRYLFLGLYFLTSIYDVATIKHLGSFSIFVYLGFSIKEFLKNNLNVYEKIIFIIVLLLELLTRLTSGLIAPLALLVLFLCLVLVIEGSKKILIVIFLVPFIIFYILFSGVKDSFRNLVWYQGKEYSSLEKVDIISDLIQENRKEAKKDKDGVDNFLWRFSYPMSALSMVLRKTPSQVPYWNGTTNLPLVTKFIPRAIYPDKPEENMGQQFGQTYKVLSATDKNTSMNTPILTELYMNFGYSGFYIGMFLFGLLFIFLDKFLNGNYGSLENKIVNMAIIFPLMIFESNFSLVFGNIFLICISLYVVFRIAQIKG